MYYPHSSWIGSRNQQQGAALIVALLVFAVAAALMAGLGRDFALQLQRGSNATLREQGWAYLRGAEALAATALRLDADQDARRDEPRDDLTELWATRDRAYPLPEGGWLNGRLEDLQGRFNINSLAYGAASTATDGNSDPGSDVASQSFSIEQQLLIRLLQTFDEPRLSQSDAIALTEAITDFIDADDQPRFRGGEDALYQSMVPAYRPANQPLASVSELRAVKGVTPELYRALAPLVTVWPPQGGKLNIQTAPLALLRSLNVDGSLDPLPLAVGQRFIDLRVGGELTFDRMLSDPVFSDGSTAALRELLVEYSDWFLLSAGVEIADREMRLYSVLERKGRRIASRFRSQGEL